MSVKTLYPTTQPSLLLDFANVKQLDPRVTFVRTTTATYYDGVTTAKAEENLLLRSQEFENAAWNKTNTTITANNATAPDGTSTAETVTATAGTNIDAIVARFNLSSTAGLDYVISFFAKAGTYSAFQITNGNFQASSAHANFDLSDGTVGTSANCTASIQNAGNSWYRCIVVFAATATVTSGAVYACLAANTSANRFQKWSPVGTETIELWGAQLEQRSSVTAYTPTTDQPITNYVPALQTAASGVARSDHNPTTFESLGLLVEEQRTNLILQSEDFGTTWATTRASVTTNTIVAPNGTLTGDKLVEDTTASNSHIIGQSSLSYTSGTSYSYSLYAKAAERTVIRLAFPSSAFGTSVAYNFDLTAGTATLVTAGTGNSASITAVGNGWYRCVVSAQATSTTNGTNQIFLIGGGFATYTGDGYSGIYIWGAQLEEGAFPTSYIPTVAATVTRNADVATMTGTNFSSWYRADEGTLYAEFIQSNQNTTFRGIARLTDSSLSSNSIGILIASNSLSVRGIINLIGVAQASLVLGNTTAEQKSKAAFVYKTDDVAGVLNAGSVLTDSSVILPVVDRLNIGEFSGGSLNGYINKIAFYPSRIPDAQLQALTT
jgi:hypothetical protein